MKREAALAAIAGVALALASPSAASSPPTPVAADFGAAHASRDARRVADWIVATNDAAGAPFLIVDKIAATLYVFGADGRLRGAAPVLVGAAIGDDTVPGIGDRPIAQVLPQERTTPAGRFVGDPGRNARGEDVVWVDYDAAVSMHRVITSNPAERRLQRLATPTPDDNRISYGCINVPRAFYEQYVRAAFAQRRAVIYVLPDVRPLREVFALDGESH